jgi:tRNA A-37 threonylcarbamoyl transferase component Bud32
MSEQQSDLTGKILGQYRLVEPIGKGGMASVYKAYQESMNRYVAIKILPHQFMHDETFLTRFEREAQVIAQLEHRSILPVHDFGEQDGIPYIVMRYVDGGTVHDLIERSGSLGLEQTTRIVRQVADALDFAHQRGIIHRDLKPRNILIDQQGDVYLSDFGIAKMLESQATLTGTGIMGTPAYIAPELAQGMKADKRVDVYALGVVVYEMLCGRVPYEADTPMGAIFKHVNEPVPSLCQAKEDIPEVVDVVVQKALAKNPDERFQTAGELASALEAAYQAVKRGDTAAQQQLTATIAGTISTPMPAERTIAAPAAPAAAPPAAPAAPARAAVPEVPAAPRRAERKGGPSPLLLIGGGAVVVLVCLVVIGAVALGGLFGGGTPTPEVGGATSEFGGGTAGPPPTVEGAAETLAASTEAPRPTEPVVVEGDGTMRLAGSRVLYEDDFSSEAPGWVLGSYADTTWQDGAMHITVTDTERLGWAVRQDQQFSDYAIDVDAQVVGGSGENYGVIMRDDDVESFVLFQIVGDNYGVFLVKAEWEPIIENTYSSAIRPDGVNHIHVEVVGPWFTIYINDEYVDSATIPEAPASGYAGVFGGTFDTSGIEFAFDNFSLREIDTLLVDDGQERRAFSDSSDDVSSWEYSQGQFLGWLGEVEPSTVLWKLAGVSAQDVVIDVLVSRVSGPTDGAAGVFCRFDEDTQNLYEFSIRDSGEYSIWIKYGGSWSSIVDWQPSSAIVQGGQNHLRMACIGDTITVVINDQVVDSVVDERVPGSGDVALAVEIANQPNVTYGFDNLIVVEK